MEPTTTSDQTLVRRAVEGDRRSLNELITRLGRVLRRRIRKKGFGRIDREKECELVQEALIILFRNEARLLRNWDPNKGASLEAWCGFIANSVAASYLRSGRRNCWREVPGLMVEAVFGAPEQQHWEARVADRIFLEKLLSRLREVLPSNKFELFHALWIEERDASEVAARIGITLSNLYVKRFRLLQRVRAEARVLLMADRDALSSVY